jgi:hypothetical protein
VGFKGKGKLAKGKKDRGRILLSSIPAVHVLVYIPVTLVTLVVDCPIGWLISKDSSSRRVETSRHGNYQS